MNEIFDRVSVRKFTSDAVEDEKIGMLMKAAMAAPSAGNQQPWVFYIVRDREVLEQLSECTPYAGPLKGAPLGIVPCYRTSDLRFSPCVMQDMSAATQNILLEAVAQGLGAVWLGVAPEQERMDKVKETIELPDGLEPFAMIACGYAEGTNAPKDHFDASRVHYL